MPRACSRRPIPSWMPNRSSSACSNASVSAAPGSRAAWPGLTGSHGAFLRLAEPVEFDALDGQPVDLVFALLVPEEATDEHLQLLSALARMFNETELRDRLRDADPEEALAILTGHSTTHAA